MTVRRTDRWDWIAAQTLASSLCGAQIAVASDMMIMQDFTDDEVRQKFGIINAIYWNPERFGAPYLTQTPINNWRIILSKISGETIPLIEDERSLLMRSDRFVYDNKDVTDILTGAGPKLQARAD